jgi:hypothetical protein
VGGVYSVSDVQVPAVRVANMVGIIDANGVGVEFDLFEGLVSEPREKTMQKAWHK